MEGSDEEEAVAVSLPETPPVKTKTLFHYFKSTPGSNPKKVEDKPITQTQDEKKRKNSLELSPVRKKIKADSKAVVESKAESEKDLKSKPVDLPVDSKLPKSTKAKTVHASGDVSNSVAALISAEASPVETKSPKVRSINNFFTKLSKDEYRKEMERTQAAAAVLTVRAMVHSPEPPVEDPVAPVKAAPSLQGKKSRSKKSNVSRSSLETDIISVIEVQEEENGVVVGISDPSKPDEKSGKISSSLFKKKSVKRPRDDRPKEEDSIDVDFFNQISKNEAESVVTPQEPQDKLVEASEKTSSLIKSDISLPKPETVTFEVKVIPMAPVVSSVSDAPVLVKSKDPASKKISSKRCPTPDSNRSSDLEAEKSPEKKVQKISNRLFGRKKSQTTTTSQKITADDNDSVDIDFSTAFSKTDSLFKDVSKLQPVEKPNLFKVKPAKPAKKKGKPALMYDSDSIDLDVLASFNSKTFCSGTETPIPESDESSNAFSVLMKKPLTIKSENPKILSPKSDSASPPNNKENEKNQRSEKEAAAIDFAIRMGMKPKIAQAASPASPTTVASDVTQEVLPEVKGVDNCGDAKTSKERGKLKGRAKKIKASVSDDEKEEVRVFARFLTTKSKSADLPSVSRENVLDAKNGMNTCKPKQRGRPKKSLSESKDSYQELEKSVKPKISDVACDDFLSKFNQATVEKPRKSSGRGRPKKIKEVAVAETNTDKAVDPNTTVSLSNPESKIEERKSQESVTQSKKEEEVTPIATKNRSRKRIARELDSDDEEAANLAKPEVSEPTKTEVETPKVTESKNAFSHLMRPKPKIQTVDEEVMEIETSVANRRKKEIERVDSKPLEEVSAFSKLMKGRKSKTGKSSLNEVPATAAANVPEVIDLDDVLLKKSMSSKRGRKKLVEMLISETEDPADSSSNEFEEPQPVTRRSSARIQKNIEETNKWRESIRQMELDEDDEEEMKSSKRKSSKSAKKQRTTDNDEMLIGEHDDDDIYVEKMLITPQKKAKSEKKLASIFIMGKKANAIKVVEDPVKVAARQAFLHSSVPQALRDQLASSKEETLIPDQSVLFPKIAHVRQIDDSDTFWNLTFAKQLNISPEEESSFSTNLPSVGNFGLKLNFPSKSVDNGLNEESLPTIERLSIDQIYAYARSFAVREGSTFPVLKIFARYLERKLECDTIEEEARAKNVSLVEIEEERMLRGGRRRRRSKLDKKPEVKHDTEKEVKYDPRNVSSMQWTMKYAPMEADDVIGNEGTIRKLQSWLGEWEARDISKRKRRRRSSSSSDSGSSSSDFTSSDDDEESENDNAKLPNTALLLGPSGVGKTSAVYALAREMGFKVLEVNASMGRSGKQVLSNLREATQSHNVRKRHKKKEDEVIKKGKKSGKQNSVFSSGQSTAVTKLDKTAVILFEDIDIIFDDVDEGFYGAVNTLIATTKRPIILTSSNPFFTKSSRALLLKHTPQTFTFKPVDLAVASKHLQLLALSEGFLISLSSIRNLFSLTGNDVSRSIVALHYWATSGGGKPETLECEPLRPDGEVNEKENFNKIEKLLFNSGKWEPVTANVKAQSGCPMPFVGIGGVTESQKSIHLLDSDWAVKTMLENGFVDLLEFNLFDMLPLPRVSRPPPTVVKKEDVKLFTRIKKPFLEDDFFTTESEHESQEMEETTGSQAESESLSQSQVESDPNSESQSQSKTESTTFGTSEVISQSNKSQVEPVRQDKASRSQAFHALTAISSVLEVQSCFFTTKHDKDPWWTTGLKTHSENPNFDPDLVSYVARTTVSRARVTIGDILENGRNSNAEDNLSIYGDEPLIDDMFVTAARVQGDLERPKHRNSVHLAQEEVLNKFLLEKTINVRPLAVDLLPTLRAIAKSEESRKLSGIGVGGSKRSRAGRFLHYFQNQGFPTLKEQTLANLCSALID